MSNNCILGLVWNFLGSQSNPSDHRRWCSKACCSSYQVKTTQKLWLLQSRRNQRYWWGAQTEAENGPEIKHGKKNSSTIVTSFNFNVTVINLSFMNHNVHCFKTMQSLFWWVTFHSNLVLKDLYARPKILDRYLGKPLRVQSHIATIIPDNTGRPYHKELH